MNFYGTCYSLNTNFQNPFPLLFSKFITFGVIWVIISAASWKSYRQTIFLF
uniref:Uncharacterized protein n=1 Tax=Rhizophora mucronata TaxID=61149 RepID=A0A2P2P0J4_RHIMU